MKKSKLPLLRGLLWVWIIGIIACVALFGFLLFKGFGFGAFGPMLVFPFFVMFRSVTESRISEIEMENAMQTEREAAKRKQNQERAAKKQKKSAVEETVKSELKPETIEMEPVAESLPEPETTKTEPVKDEKEGREIEIVIPDAIFQKINNRSQNALLERNKVGIKENKSFLVRSSTQKDLHYEIHVVRYNDGVVHLFCSCPAATNGNYCKHRINIVRGKRAGIQFPKSPTPDLKIIKSWLKDNPLKELVDSYVEFYEKEQEEHRKLSLTRRKLKIIKGKLSASFFGSELSSYTLYHLGEDD